jgi:energy-coupling factor transport system substrate-specific component
MMRSAKKPAFNFFFLLTIFLSLALNLIGSSLQIYLELPLFLDTIGTMLAAVLIGPWIGGLVGLMTNVIKGIFYTTTSLPFGLVNFGIGLITGYLVIIFKGYERWYAPLLVGCVIALLTPLMAAPIATYVFGGITAHGIDKFVVAFIDSGNTILSSTFLGRLPTSFIDKLLSAFIVYGIIRVWPKLTNRRTLSDG